MPMLNAPDVIVKALREFAENERENIKAKTLCK